MYQAKGKGGLQKEGTVSRSRYQNQKDQGQELENGNHTTGSESNSRGYWKREQIS